MSFRTRLYALPLLFSLAAMVACGGDDDNGTGPDTSGDELTQQESAEMVEALTAAGGFIFTFGGAVGASSPAAVAAAVPYSQSYSDTESCPEGGSIMQEGQISGDISEDGSSADLNYSLTQTHVDCVASSSSGRTFTFNGAPNITTSMDFVTSQTSVQIDGTQGGTLAWVTGGKSGSCGIDLTYNYSVTENSVSGSVSGTVCGNSVSETLDQGF